MMKPLISVLIPVYGVEDYIEQCLRSLFENTIADKCEFIIVNDCTKDNSMEIAARLKEEYKNLDIKIIGHEKNCGLAVTRNTGLKNASGKYFICTDSDDWVERDYLESLYDEAEKTNADVTACDWWEERDNSSKVFTSNIKKFSDENFTDFLKCDIPAYVWNKLVRRSLMETYALKWEDGINNWEDQIIFTKIFSKAKTVSCVNIPLYHYRVRNNSYIRCLINEKTKNDFLATINFIEKYLSAPEFEKYRDLLNFKKIHAKQKILIDGTRRMQKKYVALWPECYPYIKQDKTLLTRIRLILSTAEKAPLISLFLLFGLSSMKIIARKQFTWHEYFYKGECTEYSDNQKHD